MSGIGSSGRLPTALVRALLLAQAAALALFLTGPSAGSIDSDNDGFPDVPVVVAGAVFGEVPNFQICSRETSHIASTGAELCQPRKLRVPDSLRIHRLAKFVFLRLRRC